MTFAVGRCGAHPQHVRNVADALHDELREAAHGDAAVARLMHFQRPRALRQQIPNLVPRSWVRYPYTVTGASDVTIDLLLRTPAFKLWRFTNMKLKKSI